MEVEQVSNTLFLNRQKLALLLESTSRYPYFKIIWFSCLVGLDTWILVVTAICNVEKKSLYLVH